MSTNPSMPDYTPNMSIGHENKLVAYIIV
jgi:hypothetical protein